MTSRLKGVVFDMDGVIIDSERTHYLAICEAMGEGMKQSYETFLAKCTGRDERFAMGRLAELSGIEYDEELFQKWSFRKGRAYARLVSREAQAMPGAVELVLATAKQLPIALATGSRRADVDAAFEVLAEGRLKGLFQSIVTSSEVAKPKPDPETYARAVSEMGLQPEECWAIDDSPNGVASAWSAGLRVIGISGIHAPEALAQAERVESSMRQISLHKLQDWFAR
jgi:HAD superfamily hydrolase (TIGR01509 family)